MMPVGLSPPVHKGGDDMAQSTSEDTLNKTVLNGLHRELGAKMVPFAGYEMPVQYPMGVMQEHLHCRAQAGLFDVSHMGQVLLTPQDGKTQEDAARALETLVPVNVLDLKEDRQRYALFTAENGGILDDLMVANRGDHLFLVVNAARKHADLEHLRQLSEVCEVTAVTDRALLALQGPRAEAALAELLPDVRDMRFMDVATLLWDGAPLWISRSGYTGEDGFEISVSNFRAEDLARALLDIEGVAPIGLGARDSLRLEAGLCLYGIDIDETTTPAQADLGWALQKARRNGGARAGGFPGAQIILDELERGAERKRVGLRPEGRAPMRGGTPLFAEENDSRQIGVITSGAFGPSIGAPVAMGYVPAGQAAEGTRIWAELRGKRLPVTVAALPFRPSNYKR